MNTTTGGHGAICTYCGCWHSYSPAMCKDIHNRPIAPATSGVAIGTFTMEYVNKLKADHLAAMKEKDELLEKWRLACEAGTDAHKRYCDEIAAFTEKNEEIKDDMARAILAMNDQVFLIAALTARIKELECKIAEFIYVESHGER
jgi:hypothetical protein